MSISLINSGKGKQYSSVVSLEKGEVDTLLLVGGNWAKITVEVRTDDGANRPDNTPQFRDYAIMDGQNPRSTVVQMFGPIDYRVRRDERGVDSGCNVRGTTESKFIE